MAKEDAAGAAGIMDGLRLVLDLAESVPMLKEKLGNALDELYDYRIREWCQRPLYELRREHREKYCSKCQWRQKDGSCVKMEEIGCDMVVDLDEDVLRPLRTATEIGEKTCECFREMDGGDVDGQDR